jgi:hypothetical protein
LIRLTHKQAPDRHIVRMWSLHSRGDDDVYGWPPVTHEGEILLRMSISDDLERHGYEVLQAANTDHAIKILEARNDIERFSLTSICPDQWTG